MKHLSDNMIFIVLNMLGGKKESCADPWGVKSLFLLFAKLCYNRKIPDYPQIKPVLGNIS